MKNSDEILSKKIDLLIALLLRSQSTDSKPLNLREQVSWLADKGLRPAEISSLLGKKPSYVTKEMSLIKKQKAIKKEK